MVACPGAVVCPLLFSIEISQSASDWPSSTYFLATRPLQDDRLRREVHASVLALQRPERAGVAEPIGHQFPEICRLQRPVKDHTGQADAKSEILVVVNFTEVAGRACVLDEVLRGCVLDKRSDLGAFRNSGPIQ